MFLHQMSLTWKRHDSVRLYHMGLVDARTANPGDRHLGIDEIVQGLVEDSMTITGEIETSLQKDATVQDIVAWTTKSSQIEGMVQGMEAEKTETFPVSRIAGEKTMKTIMIIFLKFYLKENILEGTSKNCIAVTFNFATAFLFKTFNLKSGL